MGVVGVLRQNAALVFGAILASAYSIADASQLPNDVDLKAGYCTQVTKGRIASLNELASTPGDHQQNAVNELKDAEDTLKRLKSYLLPRFSELEPTAMIAAMKRGETDFANYSRIFDTLVDRCVTECGLAGATGEARNAALKCLSACLSRDQLLSRVRSCAKADFLPF